MIEECLIRGRQQRPTLRKTFEFSQSCVCSMLIVCAITGLVQVDKRSMERSNQESTGSIPEYFDTNGLLKTLHLYDKQQFPTHPFV